MRREFARDRRQLSGLVAEHDEIGPLGHLGVARERLAPDLRGERASALGERVGAQQRPPPPASERARHVPATDQADLHSGSAYPSVMSGP